MMIVVCIASLISLTIGAVLLYKCYQQRSAANKLKEQMKLKRFQYASTLGINLYELNNDPRLSFTYHIWSDRLFIIKISKSVMVGWQPTRTHPNHFPCKILELLNYFPFATILWIVLSFFWNIYIFHRFIMSCTDSLMHFMHIISWMRNFLFFLIIIDPLTAYSL